MARNKISVEEKYNAPFPTTLRRLMEERNKTQETIAKMTGKTRQTVSQYVNGISEPGYDVLVKIADYFNVSIDYLLGRTGDPNRTPCAADDLGLSIGAVNTIERLGMWDTPNYQITFRNASGRAMDVLNCLFESSDFDEVMGYLLLCLDSFMVNTQTRKLDGDDYEVEEEMRSAGQIVLQGADAGKFYATEAASTLKQLVCKEFPILVSSFTQSK